MVEIVASADEFIADTSLHLQGTLRCGRRPRARVDTRHLKFRSQDFRERTQIGPELLEKNVSPKRTLAGEPRLLRTWRGSQKTRSENSFDRLHILRRLQQSFTPLRENRPDLVGVF